MENKKQIEIVLCGNPVTIKKIPLIRYPEIIQAIQENIIPHRELLGDFSNQAILDALPVLLMKATPDVIKTLAVITEIEAEKIQEWGLDDFIRAIETLLELNDFVYVYNTLKKAMTGLKSKKAAGDLPQINQSENNSPT